MVRYVAFLHGINAVGKNPVEMGDLKKHFEALGFEKVSTYLQTGNVLFETDDTGHDTLRQLIEPHLEKQVGFRVPTLIRRFSEIKSAIENNPFDNVRAGEASKWYITFLSDTPANEVKGSLGVFSNDSEYARIVKNEVYIYASNYTKTHFSNSYIERKLGVSATTRNWDTVNKLLEQ